MTLDDFEQQERARRTASREKQYELIGNNYLPTLCIDARMSMNGAADPWPIEHLNVVLDFLKERIVTWVENRCPDKDFDDCVRRMIEITIRDIQNYLEYNQ